MAAHIAELDESFATVFALVGLDLVVDIEVVNQIRNLVEVRLTVVELAKHNLLHSVSGRIDALNPIVLREGLQLEDLEVLVVGRLFVEEVLVAVGCIHHAKLLAEEIVSAHDSSTHSLILLI